LWLISYPLSALSPSAYQLLRANLAHGINRFWKRKDRCFLYHPCQHRRAHSKN